MRNDRTDVGVTALAVECGNFIDTGELPLGSVDTGPIRKGLSDGK